jgi:hypothetical protein
MLHHKSRDALYNALDSYFYLDTPSNARENDMSVTSRHEDAISKRFVEHILSDLHLRRVSLALSESRS